MSEQHELWNGHAGRAWVDNQELLDAVLAPFEGLLVESLRPGEAVLDVGCGTGATTFLAAAAVTGQGTSVGVDVSEPMIALARRRAERSGSAARFLVADAETHAFAPASFDRILSRFGVMFFADFVRAFTNLRSAARPSAELRAVVWRPAAENPFMTTAERAAAPMLSNLPPRRPDGPGQFALADRERVERILQDSGWSTPLLTPVDVPCHFPARDLVTYFTRLGPLGVALQGVEPAERPRIVEAVRHAFDPYIDGQEVRFTAASWLVTARAA